MPDEQATPPRWRQRLIPKTALGISMIILAAALGSAFSGAILYSYYDYRLNKNEERVNRFVRGFDTRFQRAQDIIAFETAKGQNDIRDQLKPLEQLTASGGTLEQLQAKVSPSLWFVHTLDENGGASVGTAFVVASDDQNAFMVTSYTTVRAADAQSRARRHGPPGHRGHQSHALDVAGGEGPGAPRHPEARCAAPSVGRRQPADPHR